MLIENESEIERIREKINGFFNLDLYLDFLFLTSEEFTSKYNHYGFSFHNYISVRFNNQPNILRELCAFLPGNEYYVASLLKENINFYKLRKDRISEFLEKDKIINFVIFEKEMMWLLIYDHHRKLFGLGNHIKREIKQNINLRFGETKILYVNTDNINES